MSVAVTAKGLGKRYRILHQQASYGRFTESVSGLIRAPFDRLRGKVREETEWFWALRDVDLDIDHGDVVGIIGRNGAGKSTLLKLLSRVTEPSAGRAELAGRVASLLEVGTGFHPELTGRENIYLSGSILGMHKEETDRRFDEIVDFAGVERFLDTPVKRFSSGMQVRLGFAVAAHLEPDILIVDEVLAVGDAAFQRKCVSKMGDVAGEGRTVLVVSHNMATIESLCGRALQLDRGRIVHAGSPAAVIRQYLRGSEETRHGEVALANHEYRVPGMSSYLTRVRLLDQTGQTTTTFAQGDPVTIELAYDASACPEPIAGAGFNIVASTGARVGGFNNYMAEQPPWGIPRQATVRFTLREPTLAPGMFWITPSIGTDPRIVVDMVERPVAFTVVPRDIYGTGQLLTTEDGVAALRSDFEVVTHGTDK